MSKISGRIYRVNPSHVKSIHVNHIHVKAIFYAKIGTLSFHASMGMGEGNMEDMNFEIKFGILLKSVKTERGLKTRKIST